MLLPTYEKAAERDIPIAIKNIIAHLPDKDQWQIQDNKFKSN